MDKIHYGPNFALIYVQISKCLQQFFSYTGILVNNIFDCYWYANYNFQGAFMIIFFYIAILSYLRNICTIGIRMEKRIEQQQSHCHKENHHCKQPFCCFDVFPVLPPPLEFSSSSKSINKTTCASRLSLFFTYDYDLNQNKLFHKQRSVAVHKINIETSIKQL